MKFSTFHSFAIHAGPGGVTDVELSSSVDKTSHHDAIRYELERVRMSEDLGFDTIWLREHHFTDYGFLANTMIMAAHIAATTRRVRIGTAVVTLPLHNALRAAEDAALVDVVSGGRLTYGIGRGYQAIEYDAFGIPLDEARERADEAIGILRKVWTQPRVTHHGRFFRFDEVCLQPKPLQKPHPPLIYASISRDSVAHYAKQGIPFMVDTSITFDDLGELAAVWKDSEVRDGISEHVGPVALRQVWLAATNAEAKAYVDASPPVKTVAYDPSIGPINKDGTVAKGYEYWQKGWHGRELAHYSSGSPWENRWLAGDPDRVIERIKRLERMGYKDICVIFGPSLSLGEERRCMELFAREVMTHCR